jgi:hypothetical protein
MGAIDIRSQLVRAQPPADVSWPWLLDLPQTLAPSARRGKYGEFGVCSGVAPAFEGGVRQFRGCKTMNSIGAFSESRLPGT